MSHYFIPQWTLPDGVNAAITTGHSPGNLAAHVGADPAAVVRHRRKLVRELGLPCAPKWLAQYHSNIPVDFSRVRAGVAADAIYSNQSNSVCAVLTADCLPILICSADGQEIAAVHAGWRGLAAGIVGRTCAQFTSQRSALSAYIGPAISQTAFEVGDDVYREFEQLGWVDSETFLPHISGKWWANLPLLAEYALREQGIQTIVQSNECTFSKPDWYSYRRDATCGRFASLIWRT
ncbi:peptidoglycan editing factor PgeF [Pseudidiomarina aestuarii]|uniref:peptidoglycan editing factor PgeF n=1 Tax=Pseudidiomarina aestuarii TaxID=624146 RepID=UPI003A979BB3